MKMLIEKHICDVCGCEVTGDTRYTVELGTYDNWSDDAKISKRHKKDLCYGCYETLLGLIEKTAIHNESAEYIKKPKIVRGGYDKEELKKLWARGLTYQQIANKLGTTKSAVNNVVTRMSPEEKERVRDEYGLHKQPVREEGVRLKVTTDRYGVVQSIEE